MVYKFHAGETEYSVYRNGFLVMFLFITFTVLSSTLSLVLASIYFDTICDGLISLPILLIIYGSVSLMFLSILLIFALLIIYLKKRIYLMSGVITFILMGIFHVVWNILGSLVIFIDGKDCRSIEPILWWSFLGILIVQWAAFIISLFSHEKKLPNNGEDNGDNGEN